MRRLLALSAVMVVVAGCAPNPVTVDLNFPSQETFVRSSTAELILFDLSNAQLGRCPQLVMQAELDIIEEDGRRTPQSDVCAFRDGGVSVDDVSEGPVAYVAVVRDGTGRPLLTACTVRDIYADDAAIPLTLSPTEDYRSQFPPGSPAPSCNVEDKCSRGCR